ncbi:hypothetical protein M595_0848 [Lyngbya aestuarii BL J]|uniref:Uncharacterized protein n=2 Tax=Lyngbya aestuarii BL J TaxID=1348334 RepID=U7QM77_9CYAN|nr:hypothetical protein [Lyngbya aestuarii]ERT09079.1 hypothetical protein M595_0848 [Lyngbya aestuarii BL J]
MQEERNIAVGQLKLIRDQILNSYLNIIEKSFQENHSQFKLINYGTGSGKTHQLFEAMCQTIEKYPYIQTIGIYVAPLREHLSVPSQVKDKYQNIPVYTINSLEMKTTDKYILLYKKWIPLILKNTKLWKQASLASFKDKVEEHKQKLKTAKGVINRLDYIKTIGLGDEEYNKSEITRAKRELNNALESFLEFYIKCELEKDNLSNECSELIKIFFPLYLLRDKSGILLLTYDKFETKIPYFIHNGKKWVKRNEHLDKYVVQNTNSSRKFILAFDEQEDGYQIMLKKKIDIISPEDMAINNALSSIYREFGLIFFNRNNSNRELLNFLDRNPGAFDEFQEHLEKGKILDPELQQYLSTYQKITFEEGSSIKFLQSLISISKGIEESLADIVAIFNNYDQETPIDFNFEMISRVLAKFENTRSLLIPQRLYNQIGNDLMNIFCYNNLYIYNIKALQKLYLSKASGGHVRIMEKTVSDKTSVAELIYVILAMRSQIGKTKKILANVLDADDSQSHALDIWSKQISKVQKADEENATQSDRQKHQYLDRQYVYESNKPIINIKEISRYQNSKNNLIDSALLEVSIGSTAILTSPEYKMKSMLVNNANVIFSISATGGIYGDLTTSYDMSYMEDKLRRESGQSSFQAMSELEVDLCEEIRNYRQQHRHTTVGFFGKDWESFPNDQTKEVAERFESQILKDFIRSSQEEQNVSYLGDYKKQELCKFTRFLFYLFEDDDVQETIAFTQSLRWIKKLIEYCLAVNSSNFIFEKSSEHPSIYYVKVQHKKYSSEIRVKLILYRASFNKDYYDKDSNRTYLDELVEKEEEKIFFISAYQSASKGLNPIVKTQKGREKDFDSLVLLMDSYYTAVKSPSRKSKDDEADKNTTLYHFALMKNIVNLSESNIEIKDFNEYLSKPEAAQFRAQQHQILLGKAIVQAIGRSERRYFDPQVIKIFINEETRKNLVIFYNYLQKQEPNEIDKLSVNNYEVYSRVLVEAQKRAIKNYEDHIYDEIDADLAFQKFRKTMLEEIELFHECKSNFDINKVWDRLRDPIVFKNPSEYLENLQKLELLPNEFIDSLFYIKSEDSEFTPYLASVEEEGKQFQIISDSIHGERIYPYQQRLYPEHLKANSQGYDLEGNKISINVSTNSIYQLYNKLIPQPDIFDSYIPRYCFFYDILYPSLTESFVERWIKDIIFQGKDWKTIKAYYGFEQLLDFKKYPQLYERFDLYYICNKVLFCIDVKAWSRASGNRLSKLAVNKSKEKLKTIAGYYPDPEFKAVKGLLLNLHASQEKIHQHDATLCSGNLIYFNFQNCPVESAILRNFLFQK